MNNRDQVRKNYDKSLEMQVTISQEILVEHLTRKLNDKKQSERKS